MRALLVTLTACSIACVNVQDLGEQRAPQAAAAAPQLVAPHLVRPQPEVEPSSCPTAMPSENGSCSNVAWCSYPIDGAGGLAAKCGCTLGHWLCLRVRDDHRANPLPVAELSLTNASCTEGATCAQGTECKVSMERWCDCMSSGRFRCRRPTH